MRPLRPSSLSRDHFNRKVRVRGWVGDVRDKGRIVFFTLHDRQDWVQVVVKPPFIEHYRAIGGLRRLDAVIVEGNYLPSKIAKRGAELVAEKIEVLSRAAEKLPIDPTGRTPVELPKRLRYRILDLLSDRSRAIFKVQETVLWAVRTFMRKEGAIEVITPKIIGAATEGGADLFTFDYFGMRAFLAQSPQLYKEQLVIPFEKVYSIDTFFRAEEHSTSRHLNEFVSIDYEEAFADWRDVMVVLERLLKYICEKISEENEQELNTLGVKPWVPDLPLQRITFDEILDELKRRGVDVQPGKDIPPSALQALTKDLERAYFITEWPTELRPFYTKPCDDDPSHTESFDLNIGPIEVAGGSTRIHDPEVLARRIRECGLNPESFQTHLEVFRWGMPPHAGWAIGLSRLLMTLLELSNIREAVLFPRDRWSLIP
ncbi:aspartate--tRNA(Asn) ligase [archaeon]|nr:aspartate--tRNA(Asn) ligase [archaeon]